MIDQVKNKIFLLYDCLFLKLIKILGLCIFKNNKPLMRFMKTLISEA